MINKRVRSLLEAAALIAGFASAAFLLASPPAAIAQSGAQGVIQQSWRTYKAAITFAPAVTATSDFFTITGSATANSLVRVSRAGCYGTSTGAALIPISLIKRSAVPTVAGTFTSPTAVPVDTQFGAAAGAVVRAYTVSPTAGAAVGTLDIKPMWSTVVGTPAPTEPIDFELNNRTGESQGVILRSATQVLALNATMVAGQSVTCNVTWMEQP